MGNTNWQTSQVDYWNNIANEYDYLYKTKWSKLENFDVQKELKTLLNNDKKSILDLGCGTGLGYEIFNSMALKNFKYLGVDISKSMLSIAKSKFPSVDFIQSSMCDLDCKNEEFDVVISLFCSFSYEENSRSTVSEIYRVLKPGGLCYISMLNKFSIRRLLNMKFGEFEMYATRKSSIIETTPAKVFSKNSSKQIFNDFGFEKVRVLGQGFLSGVFENSYLWELDKMTSNLLPDFTHMITVIAYKPIHKG